MIDYYPPVYDQPAEESEKPASVYEYVVSENNRYALFSSEEDDPIDDTFSLASFWKKIRSPISPTPSHKISTPKNKKESFNKEKSCVSQLPSETDLFDCTQEIQEVFHDGFQWHDLGLMMSLAIDFLDEFFDLTVLQKRQYVTDILNRVIDMTDTPYLPDSFTDPLFKAMIPPFVTLFIPDSIDDLFPSPSASLPDQEEVELAIRTTIDTFKDGFQWEDLAIVIQMAIKFAAHFQDIETEEKADIAKTVVDSVINKTDISFLPDSFTDSIFKDLSHGLIDELFSKI